MEKNKWVYDAIKSGELNIGEDIIIDINGVNIFGYFQGCDTDLDCNLIVVFEAKKTNLIEVLDKTGAISISFDKGDGNVLVASKVPITRGNLLLPKRKEFEVISDWAVSHVLKSRAESLSVKTLNAVASISKGRMVKAGMSSAWIMVHMFELEGKLLDLIDKETTVYEELKNFWGDQLPII